MERLTETVRALLDRRGRAVVAIDGRCGSGKTTLAETLARRFDACVLHMDDFYLPPAQRAADWERTPAGNMDLARFLDTALLPVRAGVPVAYRAYDCGADRFLPERMLRPRALTIVEGSYSQHPRLAGQYDLRVFVTCARKEQEHRLRAREGEYFAVFQARWIPLEEAYFRAFGIERQADIVYDTTNRLT